MSLCITSILFQITESLENKMKILQKYCNPENIIQWKN